MNRVLTWLLALAILCSVIGPGNVVAQEGFSCTNVTEIPQIECEALVALYQSTNGAGWKDNTNWLVTNTPGDWYWITVESGHVTEISLVNNNLNGELPSQLGNLTGLLVLNLFMNNLTGPIPSELGNLSNLVELWLDFNQLTGSIPKTLANLTDLENLTLQRNQLTGTIPPELGSLWKLDQLGLGGNQLTGNIPPELGYLVNARYLSLGSNQLTGDIPPELGNLKYRTYSLWLSNNQLSGTIPPELGNISTLAALSLSNNQLTGSIPAELGNLTNLRTLRLDQNQLTGEIPASLVNLVNLVQPGGYHDGGDGLDLDYNHLNIPAGYPTISDMLQAFLYQKDPNWHLRQAFDQVIGIDGGTLTSLDDRVVVDTPAGALTADVTFTFTPQPAPNHGTSMMLFGNNSFQLTAEDSLANPITEFAQPLNITIHYSDDDIQGSTEETLGLYYWDISSAVWVDAVSTCTGGVYTRDLIANSFSLTICHLTEFAVLLQDTRSHIYLPTLLR